MTDMDALDRLIATEVDRATAPSRPVDDAAIFAAVTAGRTPRLRLGFAFSAAKYVMAVGILALFGGILLTGILSTPEVVQDPAAETESPSPEVGVSPGSVFPTGTFVSEDGTTLEFREDGTCVRDGTPCTFSTNGRGMYAEMTFEDSSGPQRPGTYLWHFDGQQLTFEHRDSDRRQARFDTYTDHVYRPVGETSPLPARGTDFPTGWFVAADHPGTTMKFAEDGLWSVLGWIGEEAEGGGSYAVSGDLFTTAAPDGSTTFYPATFYWDWDGERLTFRPWGDADHATWPEMDQVWVWDPTAEPRRRLSLSLPNLDYFVTVEISVLADGRYSATATILEGFDERPLGEGVGDTPREAVHAALGELGEPTASDLAETVPG